MLIDITRRRKELSISRAELLKACAPDITNSYLLNIEQRRDVRLTPEQVAKLEQALKLEPGGLFLKGPSESPVKSYFVDRAKMDEMLREAYAKKHR